MQSEVLIVVPTLGQRPQLLEQTLASIRSQTISADIAIVGPSANAHLQELARTFNAELVPDPGSLPAAIEAGVARAQQHHLYVTWLNDDDVLTPGSLMTTHSALRKAPQAVLAYGACEYIDESGHFLWTSQAGRWAQRILSWGPDLVPQPGMLARRDAWQRVGGLDTNLKFAFDLDLLLRLREVGEFVDVGVVVSRFRWHATSLTVADRTASLNESEAVKRRYLSAKARRWAWLWEKPVRGATRVAAARLTHRASRLSGSTR